MAADYANTLQLVRQAIMLGTPLADAWEQVVQHIAGIVGDDVALKLCGLPISEDGQRLKAWLQNILDAAPPPRGVRGLRFGLFHPDLEGRPSCDLYLVGFPAFEAEGDTWATDWIYQAPASPQSRVLDELYLISAEDRFEGEAVVVHLGLWYALLAIAELCRRHSAVLRGSAARRGVAVGFDDGELITVGVHSQPGFAPQSLAAPGKKKRRKLLPGEYFKLEGGRETLMCDCTQTGLPRELFQAFAPLDPLSLSATICPAWPNQHGTLGTLYPFICEFVTAAAASVIAAEFPGEVQFHELTIAERPGEWRIMKVLQCVTCFDREAYNQQHRLRLRKDALGGHNIFFVAEYYEGRAVLVSRAAAQLFLDLDVIGAEFVPVATS